MKIDDLPISTRAKNALIEDGIDTVEQFKSRSRSSLLRIPNFGLRSIQEITHYLASLSPPGEVTVSDTTARDIRLECLRIASRRDDVMSHELILQAAKAYEAFVLGTVPAA